LTGNVHKGIIVVRATNALQVSAENDKKRTRHSTKHRKVDPSRASTRGPRVRQNYSEMHLHFRFSVGTFAFSLFHACRFLTPNDRPAAVVYLSKSKSIHLCFTFH